MSEIKPCPYPLCVGEGRLSVGPYSWVECSECGASGPKAVSNSAAIEKWNAAPRRDDRAERIVEMLMAEAFHEPMLDPFLEQARRIRDGETKEDSGHD